MKTSIGTAILLFAIALTACTRSTQGSQPSGSGPVVIQNQGGADGDILNPAAPPGGSTSTVPGPLNGDGDWQSSGGTGVACFTDSAAAGAYDTAMAGKSPLSDELISKMKSLVTLEYWEKEIHSVEFETFPETDYLSMLEHLKRRMRLHASLFEYKLEQVDARMGIDTWKPGYKLDSTDDAKPLKAVTDRGTPNCRLVQLAVRYTKPAKLEEIPEVHVSFEPRLFAKLDALNKALLVTHERVYLIGRQANHIDSQFTRNITLNILNERNWANENAPSNIQAQSIQNLINSAFGDYVHVIFESTPPPEKPAAYSNWSRYKSMRTLIQKMRTETDKCNATKPEGADSQVDCLATGMESHALHVALNDEEAFLMIYRWMFSAFQLPVPDSEIVLIDWQERPYQEMSVNAMALACHYMEHFEAESTIFPLVVTKAQKYCTGYSAIINRPGTTGKDQN